MEFYAFILSFSASLCTSFGATHTHTHISDGTLELQLIQISLFSVCACMRMNVPLIGIYSIRFSMSDLQKRTQSVVDVTAVDATDATHFRSLALSTHTKIPVEVKSNNL